MMMQFSWWSVPRQPSGEPGWSLLTRTRGGSHRARVPGIFRLPPRGWGDHLAPLRVCRRRGVAARGLRGAIAELRWRMGQQVPSAPCWGEGGTNVPELPASTF